MRTFFETIKTIIVNKHYKCIEHDVFIEKIYNASNKVNLSYAGEGVNKENPEVTISLVHVNDIQEKQQILNIVSTYNKDARLIF